MIELIKSIPWDKLGEITIVTLVSIFVIYFIFKKYIQHENKRTDERISEFENITKVEIEKVNKEVSQIKKNVVKNSEIDVLKGTHLEENEINSSSIKVR